MRTDWEVVVIGAGAAGMFAAIEAARRGRKVLVIERSKAAGEKIRISGGGRCNFTNINAAPVNFLSQNQKFSTSALARYRPADFVERISAHGIAFHEKTLGQLFCDGSAKQIVQMLLDEMHEAGVALWLQTELTDLRKTDVGFAFKVQDREFRAESVVVACGGKSIPKMGATGFGYQVARDFELNIVETRPALVPLTFSDAEKARMAALAGVSADVEVRHGKTSFREALLFTHRGLSGPSILQISSFWREGEEIAVDFCPATDLFQELKRARTANGKQQTSTALAAVLPKRLALDITEATGFEGRLADMSDVKLKTLVRAVCDWKLVPTGSEGYRTAEVTLGGVDTNDLNATTMQAKNVAGLYFIGEVVDVTGWLGGYNFQWAWSSGWAAGQVA